MLVLRASFLGSSPVGAPATGLGRACCTGASQAAWPLRPLAGPWPGRGRGRRSPVASALGVLLGGPFLRLLEVLPRPLAFGEGLVLYWLLLLGGQCVQLLEALFVVRSWCSPGALDSSS